MKVFVVAALLGLLAWANRDLISPDYQFWSKADTIVMVQNNSDQDIKNVGVNVWSVPHVMGTIPKGKSLEFKTRRSGDKTDVVVRFGYGNETIERQAGTLTDQTGYRILIAVNYAGVVTTQVGPPGQEVPQQLP
ncbi:MAG TPA: hypothetical protein VGJ57_07205 [Nitrospirales bacterium]|jgi:hypothetical protein